LRILAVGSLYPPHHLGGYELIWQSAMRFARERGHEVRVLATDHRESGRDEADEEPGIHRELRWYWRDHEFPRLSPRARRRLERHNAEVLDRHVREFRPDAVSWWAMGGMSMSLIERAPVPAVGVVCDDWMLYGPKVDQWARMLRRRPRFGNAATWLFISETTRSRALRLHDLPRTGLAHAGVDASMFVPAPERDWDWRLLYVGRIDPRKGIDTAVDALAALPDPAVLEVVGSGDAEHLAALRSRAGSRVRFAPLVERPRLPGVYAGADAVLFPVSWAEPWGLVPLEAMAVGRPVVATGMGGSGEYLRDGENCVLVPPGDPAAVAAAVRRLAEDRALRARLREGGFETAARYTERACNDAILDALERAAVSRA
jgi:glycogen synthase